MLEWGAKDLEILWESLLRCRKNWSLLLLELWLEVVLMEEEEEESAEEEWGSGILLLLLLLEMELGWWWLLLSIEEAKEIIGGR